MRRLDETLQHLIAEMTRSVEIHGEWEHYFAEDINDAVQQEFREYLRAFNRKDVAGPHGQRAELLQLATVALKGYIRLGDKS